MSRFLVRLPDRRVTTGVDSGVDETTVLPGCSLTDGSGFSEYFEEPTLVDKNSHHSQVMEH